MNNRDNPDGCENGRYNNGTFTRCESVARFFWRFDRHGVLWVSLCAECFDELVAMHKADIAEGGRSRKYAIDVLKLNGVI